MEDERCWEGEGGEGEERGERGVPEGGGWTKQDLKNGKGRGLTHK